MCYAERERDHVAQRIERAQARRILHKTTETAGPRGYDAGKKVKDRKHHLLIDTNGLPAAAVVLDDLDRPPAALIERGIKLSAAIGAVGKKRAAARDRQGFGKIEVEGYGSIVACDCLVQTCPAARRGQYCTPI